MLAPTLTAIDLAAALDGLITAAPVLPARPARGASLATQATHSEALRRSEAYWIGEQARAVALALGRTSPAWESYMVRLRQGARPRTLIVELSAVGRPPMTSPSLSSGAAVIRWLTAQIDVARQQRRDRIAALERELARERAELARL